jgi:hypothetical protein
VENTQYFYNTGKQQVFFNCMPRVDYFKRLGLTPMTDIDIAAYNESQASILIPNVAQFTQDVKTAMGGILALNALMVAYPSFFPSVSAYEWSDLQALVLDAHAKSFINDLQYSGIKAAAIINNISISL